MCLTFKPKTINRQRNPLTVFLQDDASAGIRSLQTSIEIKTLPKPMEQTIAILRRISCDGRNHSHTRCEYSETIFLCYHHHSEYSLLGSKFSTNLLFAASKCHVTIQRQYQFKMLKMAEGSDGCSGETLLAPCTRKKRLQRKMTKDNYRIGVQENIGMFSKL